MTAITKAVAPSRRLASLPTYHAVSAQRSAEDARSRGIDVISLASTDGDLPSPPAVVEALRAAALDVATHSYAPFGGLPELREEVSRWMARRYGVHLDPDAEVALVPGAKDGMAFLALASLEAGDTTLCPDPGYAGYAMSTILAGAQPVALRLSGSNDWLPRLDEVPARLARSARLLWLNFPGNPTGATAPREHLEEAVAWCRRNDVLLVHDAAYAEVCYGGYRAPSILEIDGAAGVAVELHTLSKTFNMAGWRVGWLCGNRTVVASVAALQRAVTGGIFAAVQRAAAVALRVGAADVDATMLRLASRRDRLVAGLRTLGVDVHPPAGGYYVWGRVPSGVSSDQFVAGLAGQCGVMLAPGTAFGAGGAGYVRASMMIRDDLLDEALARFAELPVRT